MVEKIPKKLVFTYNGRFCITGLACTQLPKMLREWVKENCEPDEHGLDLWMLPSTPEHTEG